MSLYRVQRSENECNDYTVKVNGKNIPLDTARVSAVPFNRRWPGHQRQIDQSELINFLSFSMDSETEIEIYPKDSFKADDVKIRPLSSGIKYTVTDNCIKLTLDKWSYFTVEPYGRNRALHIFADPRKKYKISDSEELIYFGEGVHDVGDIELKSNQTLFIDEGALVYATIHAIDADNIRIIGHGILDNSRNKEQILFDVSDANVEGNREAIKNAKRKHTIHLEYCNNIEIDGITIRDSLVYNIKPIACTNIEIRNVKIIGCWRFNSDGIDMHNCINVHISDCFIRTFDDSICIKGFDCYYSGDIEEEVRKAMYRNGKSHDIFKNVLIENCVIWNDWGRCLEIGAETRAEEIFDVTFKHCFVIHAMHAVLDVQNVDYADVHDLVYEDIEVEYDNIIPKPMLQKNDAESYVNTDFDYVPTLIYSGVKFHHEYSAGGTRRGKNRNITFRNIRLCGRQPATFTFKGYDSEHMCENILLENIYQNGVKIEELAPAYTTKNEFVKNIVLK